MLNVSGLYLKNKDYSLNILSVYLDLSELFLRKFELPGNPVH